MIDETPLVSEFNKLLEKHGLENELQQNEKALAKSLVDNYEGGEIDKLGSYGRALLNTVFDDQELRESMYQEKISGFPMFDGSGKVGRYLVLINRALKDMGVEYEREIYFNEFPTRQFNACVKPTDKGLLCLLNTGLMKLIYHVSVASFFSVYGESNDGEKSFKKSSTEKVAILATIKIILNYLDGKTHTHVIPNKYKLNDMAMFDATCLSFAIRIFVLSHEIGHVVLGHTEEKLERMIVTPNSTDNVVSRLQKDEYEADSFSQKILLHIDEKGYFPSSIASGGLGFLIIHLMIINVMSKITGLSVKELSESESHPSTWDRVKRLDNLLRDYFSNKGNSENLSICVSLQKVLSGIEKSTITRDEKGIHVHFSKD